MTVASSTFSSGDNGHLVIIEGHIFGYDLKDFSQFPKEDEILLEPETIVEVVGIDEKKKTIQCRQKQMGLTLFTVAPLKPEKLKYDALKALIDEKPKVLIESSVEVNDEFPAKHLKTYCELLKSNMVPTNELIICL